jgi:heat shock protein HslJ
MSTRTAPRVFLVDPSTGPEELPGGAVHGDMLVNPAADRTRGVRFVMALDDDGRAPGEKRLVRKDETGSGYCSVPIEITRAFPDPVAYYKFMRITRPLMGVFAVLMIAACGQGGGIGSAPTEKQATAPADPEPAKPAELAHTAWQLVRISKPGDTALTPDDPSAYTLTFEANGNAVLRIDCNRGSGSWMSDKPGELEFGPIASTRAMCPPESLHDPYLAHFERVTRYTIEDDHLFLRSGDDGAYIEMQHSNEAPVAATVLGEEIRTDDAAEMQQAILKALFERYEAEKGIAATDAEIDAFVGSLDRAKEEDIADRSKRLAEMDRRLESGELDAAAKAALEEERKRLAEFVEDLESSDELSAEEAAQATEMRRSFAREMITHWKLNRALYEQYGGRIIGQQLGPEPLDAYREFLEEQQTDGAFEIHREEFSDEFWRYFTDDSMHSFIDPDSDEGRVFEKPPWED